MAAVIAASVALTAVLAACSSPEDLKKKSAGNPSPEGTEAASSVEALYKRNCYSCHMAGDKLAKRVAPKYSREQLLGIVTNGRNGMPAFKGKLKEEELNALADWLSSANK